MPKRLETNSTTASTCNALIQVQRTVVLNLAITPMNCLFLQSFLHNQLAFDKTINAVPKTASNQSNSVPLAT
jgi:hypothetical protein